MNIFALLGSAITNPLQKLLAGLEPHVTETSAPAVSAAKVDPSLEKVTTAIEAVTDPMIKAGLTGIAEKVPVLGPALASGAVVEALSVEHTVLQGIVDEIKKILPAI